MTGPTPDAPTACPTGELPRSTGVVVVGAGITGASIGHHLALRGIPVTVVEQAPGPGAGATGRSGGMVRGYDPDPAIGELARPSLAVYRDPARWASGRAPLRAVGAITVTDPADEPALRGAADRINRAPDTSAYVVTGRDEIMGVRLDDGAALVEPDAGWVPPVEVTRDWLGQAVTNGASLHYGTRVLGVEDRGGRPVVRTSAGEIRAGAVVAATGLWTARPPQGLRPSSPVRSRSIQISIVRREPPAPAHATFIDLRTGVYARPVDANHSLIGMPHLVWDSPFDSASDPAHARATAQAVGIHLPWAAAAEQVSVVRAADGYGEHSAILARTRLPHVWSVRGWNGGGVKTAPEAGRRIANALLTRAFTHDA
ncbi:NAD(P)/FAD-dependent oxidoreductase [Streptomyces hokutonensis]|uniref:NAD(P)/FAD-dependent oxidoreductase n=1 Tax=Streptomyces hokutonensis TaxID=1306990 RepID=UPI0036C44A97